jgi:hypothetical protein
MRGHTWNKSLLTFICCQLIPCAYLTSAAHAEQPLDEVNVTASKLMQLRVDLDKAQDAFFDEYNKINTVPEYATHCGDRTYSASRIAYHVCEPNFVTAATENEAYEALMFFTSNYGALPPSAATTINQKMPGYRQHVHEIAERSPRLAQKARDFLALSQRYEATYKAKFTGRMFVWQ